MAFKNRTEAEEWWNEFVLSDGSSYTKGDYEEWLTYQIIEEDEQNSADLAEYMASDRD